MQQSKTGTYVPAPKAVVGYTSSHSAGSKGSSGTPYKGSKDLSSNEESGPENHMGTNTSEASSQNVKGANVKRTGYETPPADLGGNAYLQQGGRGPGGY